MKKPKTIPLTSNGYTGQQWLDHFRESGIRVSSQAEKLLLFSDFSPAPKGTEYQVAILRGDEFADADRTTKNIRAKAKKLGYSIPPAEVACLLCEKFTDEEMEAMGLSWIATMHEPIIDSDGYSGLLGASRYGGNRWLRAYSDRPGDGLGREIGFAFLVPHKIMPPNKPNKVEISYVDSRTPEEREADSKIEVTTTATSMTPNKPNKVEKKIAYMKKDGKLPEGYYIFSEPNIWSPVLYFRKPKNAKKKDYELVKRFLTEDKK